MIDYAAIICARMGSKRIPGKVLAKIVDGTMLEYIFYRIDDLGIRVVLATTIDGDEEPLIEMANKYNVKVVRGSELDVLDRIISAAKTVGAKNVVRLCGDNPLVDPKIINLTMDSFIKADADYAVMANLPAGISSEIIKTDALIKLHELIVLHYPDPLCPDRIYLLENATLGFQSEFFKDAFKIEIIKAPDKWCRSYRLTVDEPDDLKLMNHIFTKLRPDAGLDKVINYLDTHPDIANINKHVKQLTTIGFEQISNGATNND